LASGGAEELIVRFRPLPAPRYAACWVSDDGRIWRRRDGQLFPCTVLYGEGPKGPARSFVTDDEGGQNGLSVARMVLTAFVRLPEAPLQVARSRDGDRKNCRLDNLYWGPRWRRSGTTPGHSAPEGNS